MENGRSMNIWPNKDSFGRRYARMRIVPLQRLLPLAVVLLCSDLGSRCTAALFRSTTG